MKHLLVYNFSLFQGVGMNIALTTFLLTILAFPWPSAAQTAASEMITRVQTRHADRFAHNPILIMDMDELWYRYATNQVFINPSDDEPTDVRKFHKRMEITHKYIKEKTGVEIEDATLGQIDLYTAGDKDGVIHHWGLTLPIIENAFLSRPEDILFQTCLIFPANPNLNQRLRTEDFLKLRTKDVHGAYPDGLTYTGIKHKIDFKTQQLLTLYHELGHCIDRHFFPKQVMLAGDGYLDPVGSAHRAHQSEAFAESFAIRLMWMEGQVKNMTEVIDAMAHRRNISTRMIGPWFAAHPENGFGIPHHTMGGVIYYLTPIILETRRQMVRFPDPTVKTLDLDKLSRMTKETVIRHSLSPLGIDMITQSFTTDVEEIKAKYRPGLINPEVHRYHVEGFADLLTFLEFSPAFYARTFGDTPDQNDGKKLAPITRKQICALTGKKQLWQRIDLWRQELQTEGYSHDSQLQRKKELDDVYRTYSTCADKI